MADKEPPRQPIAQTSVVLLSQYMFPESNATSDLLTSLAMGLVASGFTVTAFPRQLQHGSW